MTSDTSPQPISPLRARMIEDMSVRGFKEDTRRDYVRQVRAFALAPDCPRTGLMSPLLSTMVNEKFDPDQKQLVTFYEAENGQIFIDEERLSSLGLTLADVAHFLESQPFVFAAFTIDDVRNAAALRSPDRAR
jgi:hypothetical protein